MVETKRAYCDFGRRFKLNAIPHNETYRFFFPNQGEVSNGMHWFCCGELVPPLLTMASIGCI
jgi:hypothetical protein